MKKLLLFLLCCITAQAQSELKKAVYKDCINEKLPAACTSAKLELGLHDLFTQQINYYVNQKAGTHFALSYVVIIDGNGKVIPEQVYVDCEILALRASVIDYLKNLPEFTVPDALKKQSDKRTVYFNNLVFIFDEKTGTYTIAGKEKAKELNIEFNVIKYGTQPILKDCKDADDKTNCTTQNLQKKIGKKFRVPKLSPGVYKFAISFSVGYDGKLEDIITDDSRFEQEANRVMKKIDDFLPGTIQGIPVRVRYKMPITITIRE